MVCSRSGVRLYAATPRSGPGLLCAAARFGFAVLKKNLSLLEGLDFTPAASATTKFIDRLGIDMTMKTCLNFTPAASATTKFKDSLGINMTMKTFFKFRTE